MSELIRGSLELLRVVLIVFILNAVLTYVISVVYHLLGIPISLIGSTLVFVATLIVAFMLYRNKFQFHGFYRGKSLVKLSEKTTRVLIIIVAALLIVAPFLK